MPRYYSEYGEDEWIAGNLAHLLPERGIYLDLGCGHPEHGSNTAFLRDLGWVGLAVDGHEPYAPHWIGRQQFVHAILSSNERVRFQEIPENSAMCRIVADTEENRSVKKKRAVKLETLLASTFGKASPPITRIDVLSMDLEGAEFDVFNSWRTYQIPPAIIIAEHSTLGLNGEVNKDLRLRDFLVAGIAQYEVVHETVANFIYRRL